MMIKRAEWQGYEPMGSVGMMDCSQAKQPGVYLAATGKTICSTRADYGIGRSISSSDGEHHIAIIVIFSF
jgi:hypothetical protein